MKRYTSVDDYIDGAEQWHDELVTLRGIITRTELEETVKWGAPCYTLDGKNVVGLGAFKSYVGLWFHHGALLSDPDGVLINAQEGKTKAQRQWRFTSPREIKVRRITAYLKEAIALQRAGRTIRPTRAAPVVVPPELAAALAADRAAEQAFAAMSPSCQREYANHVAEAKRADTKVRRVEKILPMIVAGGGLHDRYRNG